MRRTLTWMKQKLAILLALSMVMTCMPSAALYASAEELPETIVVEAPEENVTTETETVVSDEVISETEEIEETESVVETEDEDALTENEETQTDEISEEAAEEAVEIETKNDAGDEVNLEFALGLEQRFDKEGNQIISELKNFAAVDGKYPIIFMVINDNPLSYKYRIFIDDETEPRAEIAEYCDMCWDENHSGWYVYAVKDIGELTPGKHTLTIKAYHRDAEECTNPVGTYTKADINFINDVTFPYVGPIKTAAVSGHVEISGNGGWYGDTFSIAAENVEQIIGLQLCKENESGEDEVIEEQDIDNSDPDVYQPYEDNRNGVFSGQVTSDSIKQITMWESYDVYENGTYYWNLLYEDGTSEKTGEIVISGIKNTPVKSFKLTASSNNYVRYSQHGTVDVSGCSQNPSNTTSKIVSWVLDEAGVLTESLKETAGRWYKTFEMLKPGDTKVTAKTDNGVTASTVVHVVDWELEETKAELSVGETFKNRLLDAEGKTLSVTPTWSTDNMAVATVDSAGNIRAAGVGAAKISARVYGLAFTCNVIVTDKLQRFVIGSPNVKLEVSESESDMLSLDNTWLLRYLYYPAAAEAHVVSYKAEIVEGDEFVEVVTSTLGENEIVNLHAIKAMTAEDAPAKVKVTAVTDDGEEITADNELIITTQEYEEIPFDAVEVYNEWNPLYVITNLNPTLSSVVLPGGWQWMNGAVSLKSYAGNNMYHFSAKYVHKNSGQTYYQTIPVRVMTVSGVDASCYGNESSTPTDKTKMLIGTAYELKPAAAINGGSSYNISETLEWKFEFAEDYGERVKFERPDDLSNYYFTATEAGIYKCKETLVTKGENPVVVAKKDLTFTVIDPSEKGVAEPYIDIVEVKDEDVLTIECDSERDMYTVHKGSTVMLRNRTEKDEDNLYKVTYKSTNTGILTIGAVAADSPELTKINLLKAGVVTVNATIDDAVGTHKTINIRVIDPVASSVSVDKTTLTFNKYKTDEYRSIPVTVIDGFGEITTPTFDVENVGTCDLTVVKSVGRTVVLNATKPGTAKLKVSYDTGEVTLTKEITMTVKIGGSLPTVNIRQIGTYDSLLQSQPAFYECEAVGAKITDVTVLDTNVTTVDWDGGWLEFDNVPAKTTKVKVSINLEGYNTPVVKEVKINKTEPSFALSSTGGSFYVEQVEYDNLEFKVKLIDKKTKQTYNFHNNDVEISSDFEEYCETSVNGEFISLKLNIWDPYQAMSLIPSKGKTIKITVKDNDNWKKSLTFSYKVTRVANVNKLKLTTGASTLTLNNYNGVFNSVNTSIALGGADDECLSKTGIYEVVAKGKTPVIDKDLRVYYNQEDKNIYFEKISPDLKAGTYKFKFVVPYNQYHSFSKVVTLKVVNIAETGKNAPSVKVTAKGTIDVLSRELTPVTLTAKFSKIAGYSYIDGQIIGPDSGLFDKIYTDDKGTIKIKLKDGAAVLKGVKYKVAVKYNIFFEDGSYKSVTSPTIQIKMTQKKPKVSLSGNTVFNMNSFSNSQAITPTIINGSKQLIGVKTMAVTSNVKNSFGLRALDGDWELVHRPNGNTASGKSYTLVIAVTPEGAFVNEKPVSVKYKVSVK